MAITYFGMGTNNFDTNRKSTVTLTQKIKKFGQFRCNFRFCSYSLSNVMHTFNIYCSVADKPSIQTRLWLLVTLFAVPAGEKIKNFASVYTGNRSSCHSKEKWMQNSVTKTAKYFDVIKTYVSLWEWLPVHTTHKCVGLCFCAPLTNWCTGVKHPYSPVHMPSNMG